MSDPTIQEKEWLLSSSNQGIDQRPVRDKLLGPFVDQQRRTDDDGPDSTETNSKCPFLQVSEENGFEWEESRHELASRLDLGSDWATCATYPKWQRRLLIKEVARAYLKYRVPLHILEYRLTLISMRLKERIRISYTGSGSLLILFCETQNNDANTTDPSSRFDKQDLVELIPMPSSDMNLAKMVAVEKIADSIIQGDCCIHCLYSLLELRRSPATVWPAWFYLPASVGMALAYSPLFAGAGLYELFCAMSVALLCSALESFWPIFHRLGLGKEMLLAFISASSVSLFHLYIHPINCMNAILSSIVFHLPGLAITNSVTNVCFGHVNVGAGGFMEVMIISANLGIGVLGGLGVGGLLNHHPIYAGLDSTHPFPFWVQFIAIVWAVFPTTILFKGKLSHIPFYAVGTFTAFFGAYIANNYLHTGQFSACFGATLTGLLANAYGRWTNFGPSVELMLLSIIAIVPGGFSLNFATASDTGTATSLLKDMVVIALGIVTGQFVSCAIIKPKRQL